MKYGKNWVNNVATSQKWNQVEPFECDSNALLSMHANLIFGCNAITGTWKCKVKEGIGSIQSSLSFNRCAEFIMYLVLGCLLSRILYFICACNELVANGENQCAMGNAIA